MENNILDGIADKYGTDKKILCHGYTRAYEKLFLPIRHDVKNIIEAGIFDGASLRMWRDYFPNATVHGLDIEQKSVDCVNSEERIKSTLISACNASYWDSLDFKADIIIDDGSHVVEEQMVMIRLAWNSLKPGGYYVIEDTHSSFLDVYKQDKSRINGYYSELQERILKQQAYDTLQGDWYITRDKFKHQMDKISYETFGIYSFTSLIIFEKTVK